MFTLTLSSNCAPAGRLICLATTLGKAVLGSLILALPVHAQVCEDTDGDGWGWDGSASCVVTAPPSGPVATGGSAACVDNDGDGFGWDGSNTCIVGGAVSGSGNSDSGAVCVDSDGDGWGWDGTGSCAISGGGSNEPVVQPQAPATTNPTPVSSSGFNAQRDLVALHFDHAPDRDDAHAAVAALMVRDKLGLNVQVVAGTYGTYSRDRYDAQSEQVMAAVWGSEWLNAHQNYEGSVSAAVNRWASVLAAGGAVWVAEGGPADFTAEVVRRIRTNHSEFDTNSRIHVIQHSDWNENHSLAADLNYARSNTRYVKIADGNDPNATADFRFESHNNGAFVSRAQSSRYSSEWGAAFNYLAPSEKLDFSDTVELLHIVGLGTNVIRDVNEFGDYFF